MEELRESLKLLKSAYSRLKEALAIEEKSDIDVAIVSPLIPESATERAKLKLKIIDGYNFSPLEVHLLKPSEWNFYRNFVKDEFREI